MKKPHSIWLIYLLLLFFGLRLVGVADWMRFTGDEARDAVAAYKIVRGLAFPLLGPKVHLGFGNLGPAYYYLLALPTYLFNGHAMAAGVLTAVIDLFSIALLYRVGSRLFNWQVGFVSAVIYGVSFTAIFYARWGWHPSLVPFFALLAIHGLLLVQDGHERALPQVTLALALGVQFHLSMLLLGPVLLWVLWQRWREISARLWLFSLGMGIYPLLPILWYEVTNGWPNTLGLLNFFTFKGEQLFTSPWPYLLESLQIISSSQVIHRGIQLFPDSGVVLWLNLFLVIGGVTVLLVTSALKRKYWGIVALWAVLPPLVMALYTGTRPDYYLLLWFPIPILLVALFLVWVWQQKKQVAMGLAITLILINLMAGIMYARYLQSLEQTYSFFYAAPLQQKSDAVSVVVEHAGKRPFDVTIVSWNWPNHIPYNYLLMQEPKHPAHMLVYESASGTDGPFTLHVLDTNPYWSPVPVYSAHGTYILREPDTLPMPPTLSSARYIDQVGTIGIYYLPPSSSFE